MRRRLGFALLAAAVFPVALQVVPLAAAGTDWGPVQFLVGRWTGEGGGAPGAGTGAFSFTPDLQGAVLVRKSFAEYPAAGGRPAARHDDLTLVYRDGTSPSMRALYFDNEGHVIPYVVRPSENGVVFTSDGQRDQPRYRLTYTRDGPDHLRLKFEIAPPGKEFHSYIESVARREAAAPPPPKKAR
ncbi:MAG: hypothetical protein LAP40_27665 [Acidobacteriia bacterium]|nr:hypothetical protein [Terriglobia bacterium]